MMALSTAYSWIFSIILLNHGIITVNSFPLSIEGLVEFGLDLLLDYVLNNDKEETEEFTMTDIAFKIDDIENTVKDSATNVINEVGHILRSEQAMRDFTRDVSYISTLYDWFKEFSNGSEKITLEDYADVCLTAADNGLKHRLKSVMHLISPYEDSEVTPLFNLIIERYRKSETAAARCDKWQSVQQEIYRMYGDVVIYLVKGYTMVFNAYDIKGKVGYKRFRTEKSDTITSYKKAIRKLTRSAVAAMREAPRDIRGCDPRIWEEGESYIELKWLFNGFFIPEWYLSESFSCGLKCDDYSGVRVSKRPVNTEWPLCDGFLYNCRYSFMQYACPGANPWKLYSGVGKTEADLTQCSPKPLITDDEQTREDADVISSRCDMCFCSCDYASHMSTVREFSLRAVVSKSSENKVITGLRFVEVNRCIYIQIQEGKLMADGYIDKSSTEWQPVKESSARMKVAREQKTVYLGTIDLPAHSVMTGVSFDWRKGYVQLRIRGHFFDYSLGTLRRGNLEYWYPQTDKREPITIEAPDVPSKAKSENVVTSEDNSFVDFRMTDEDKDFAQTAIPFLDAQPVISDPPRPLAGAGLYYRGQEGYGGFIALKLVAYDYAKVLAKAGPSIPDLEEDIFKVADDTEGKSPRQHRGKRRRKHDSKKH